MTAQSPFDVMLRRTWAHGFDDRVVARALECLGDRLLAGARQSGQWGTRWSVAGDLAAVADDLDALAACLEELVSERGDAGDESRLLDAGNRWAKAARKLAAEVRGVLP